MSPLPPDIAKIRDEAAENLKGTPFCSVPDIYYKLGFDSAAKILLKRPLLFQELHEEIEKLQHENEYNKMAYEELRFALEQERQRNEKLVEALKKLTEPLPENDDEKFGKIINTMEFAKETLAKLQGEKK